MNLRITLKQKTCLRKGEGGQKGRKNRREIRSKKEGKQEGKWAVNSHLF